MDEDEMRKFMHIQELTKNLINFPERDKLSKIKILSILRGEDESLDFEDGAWINVKFLEYLGEGVEKALFDCDNDIERDGERVRAIYGHVKKAADTMYGSMYKRYGGGEKVWCFTHTTEIGFAAINSKRTVNILYSKGYAQNKGVMAYLDLNKHPEIEIWSKIDDKYGNTVFCFKHDLSKYFEEKKIYLPTYISSFEREHIDNFEKRHFHLLKMLRIYLEKNIEAGLVTEEDLINRSKKLFIFKKGDKTINMYDFEKASEKKNDFVNLSI